MARPRAPTLGEASEEAWEVVEEVRSRLCYTPDQMAEELGFKSGSAYRNRRRRREMPTKQWEAFLARFAWMLQHEIDRPGNSKTIPYGVRTTHEERAYLKWLGNGNTSQGVRKLIEFHRRHHKG